MATNLLFYKVDCNMCIDLRNKLQEYGILSEFNSIEVTERNKAELFKNGLRYVPTIVLNATKEKINGLECFNWFYNYINIPKSLNVRKPPKIVREDVVFFNELEMGGTVTDLYTDLNPSNDKALPKNFLPEGTLTEIVTPPLEDNKKHRYSEQRIKQLTEREKNERNHFIRELKEIQTNEREKIINS